MKPLFYVALAASLTFGCSGRKSARGFHLPDGDPAAGRDVFVSLQCHACHQVAGESLPIPVAQPAVLVELGGQVPQPRTDGELVTAIIHPSHRLEPAYRRETYKAGSLSRMGDFSEAMTVADLINLVSYLQSRYQVVPPPPPMR